MIYVVFEAGSRCGTSARLFFNQYVSNNPSAVDDSLLLVDMSEEFVESATTLCNASHIGACLEKDAQRIIDMMINDGQDVAIFPADELTRQRGYNPNPKWWNDVKKEFYDKEYVNARLASHGVTVPPTFRIKDVIVKPNSQSAGSKGIQFLDNVCISKRIDIAHEYVVDMFVTIEGQTVCYPREVKLKNGYDHYIKFLPQDSAVVAFAKHLPLVYPQLFSGPCHCQLIEDNNGVLYYVEGSKRLSGTSMVAMLFGYNPFELVNGAEIKEPAPNSSATYGEWYSFDSLRSLISRMYE